MNQLHIIFQLVLLCSLLISFYFFVDTIIFKNKHHKHIFSTWQFPMLLAIYIDVIYNL